MFHMIGHIFFGLIVGIVAKLLTPGHDPGGIIVTIVLGIVGAWVGGQLGQWLGWYQGNCASSTVKTEELHEVGKRPARPLAFDFHGAFAGIAA
jgi:uncharacterized membrane protein YeaQ/YmgE (transglycosylase-associated protein family)